jgi:hypothetical protein
MTSGLTEGRRLRDEGVAKVQTNHADEEWRTYADMALAALIRTGEPFTAADVIDRAGMPSSPNAVGALFVSARKSGAIRKTGRWVPSRRAASHARELREWVAV